MQPLSEVFVTEAMAWSLPPRFGAVGEAMPIGVEVALDPSEVASIDVVDVNGVVLTSLTPAAGRFWNGEIPGGAVVGEQLTFRAVARLSSGDDEVTSPDWTVPLYPASGFALEQRPLQLDESLIPIDVDELGLFFPEVEGALVGPVAVGGISSDEIAVLDTVNKRLVCFGLDGQLRCDVPLTIVPDGDLLALGDGTLLVIDFEGVLGRETVQLLRVDPSTGDVDAVFAEDPLVVDGFPAGIANNSTFELDTITGTAWLSLPEVSGPSDTPDPSRFPYADAFHLDTPVTRGPTVFRPAFRPDASVAGLSVVDGGAWARFDGIGGGPSVLTWDTTPAGAIVMLVGWADDTGPVSGVVRWIPGEQTYEFAPTDYEFFDGSTSRVMTVLGDEHLVILDQGNRLRLLTPNSAD